jgi:uncharacterized protein YndB with AHSA1/START domain
MWFHVHPVDIGFTLRSPFQFHNEIEIKAPPARVFEIMATAENQHEWFKDYKDCRWTSAPPHGAGSTREIELKAITVKERFLVWEPGKRMAFCIYAGTLPLVREMVEDIEFLPGSAPGTTHVRWIAHYTPTLPARLVHPIIRSQFGKMFKQTLEGLRTYAER